MSKIDHQALREAAERATPAMERLLMLPVDDDLLSEQELKDYGVDIDALNAFKFLTGPETVLALLDENIQLQRGKDAIEAVALVLRDDMRQAREQLAAAEKRNSEQREYYEGVIADGGKRIAELEKGHQEAAKQINSWRRLAKQNIAERGKDISELEAARQHIAEQSAIVAAAEKLVRCKGRYHSELNYRALAKLFGVVTPDLPPLEHENVHYADAAEVEITALRQRIQELEARAVNLPKRSVGEVMHLSGFSRDYAEGWCAGNDNAMHEIRAAGIKVKGE
ncbi:ead/Ea22-like family protein [Salmonella enterica]|uniref:ead/Ea22-like family protein n=2 Tax=Salmonella enterica TaxID=28901 RepID=UPI0020CA29ED|nr:ead/Ea22-like family protein [Salmonella enterica]